MKTLDASQSGYKPTVSIVIAARNEENLIINCIQSCLDQNYPESLLEIIVVDDQSEDDTYQLVADLQESRVVLMRLGVYKRTTIKGSKKKAIAYGINHAKGEIICTTDADCIVPKNWIATMIRHFEDPSVKLVSGPVKIIESASLINRFQVLDFSANGLVNAVGIFTKKFCLGSAANLAYRKDTYLEIDAFENNYHIPSGDDVLLMQHIKKRYPHGIVFAKSQDAIIETYGKRNWSAFINQRLRWAGKMDIVTDFNLKLIPVLVWIQRLFIYGLLILSIVLKEPSLFLISFCCLILQWLVDFILQMDACKFYKIRKWEIWFVPIAFLHSFYFLFLGVLSKLPLTNQWKGRRI